MAANKESSAAPDLSEIRKRINEIDERIQSLINERARFAQQVGVAKGELANAVDYYRPDRSQDLRFHFWKAGRGESVEARHTKCADVEDCGENEQTDEHA